MDLSSFGTTVATKLPPQALARGWDTVSDEDLQRPFAATAATRPTASLYTVRCLAKRGLRAMVEKGGDPARRWPLFWTHGRIQRQTTQREICVSNAIPFAVFREGPQGVL